MCLGGIYFHSFHTKNEKRDFFIAKMKDNDYLCTNK